MKTCRVYSFPPQLGWTSCWKSFTWPGCMGRKTWLVLQLQMARLQWSAPGPEECQNESLKRCQIECQKRCQIECQSIYEKDRVSEYIYIYIVILHMMPYIYIYYICTYIYILPDVCQKLCQNGVSGRWSLEKTNFSASETSSGWWSRRSSLEKQSVSHGGAGICTVATCWSFLGLLVNIPAPWFAATEILVEMISSPVHLQEELAICQNAGDPGEREEPRFKIRIQWIYLDLSPFLWSY